MLEGTGRHPDAIASDTREVIKHFEAGKGWGLGPFARSRIKACRYLREVRIGGRPCRALESLRDLASWLDVDRECRDLNLLWREHTNLSGKPFCVQVSEYGDLCEPLASVLDLYEVRDEARAAYQKHGLAEPTWHDLKDVEGHLSALRAADARARRETVRQRAGDLRGRLQTVRAVGKAPSEVGSLLSAFEERDVRAFREAREALERLHGLLLEADERRALLDRLRSALPETAAQLEATFHDEPWSRRAQTLERAWRWGACRAWVRVSTIIDGNVGHSEHGR